MAKKVVEKKKSGVELLGEMRSKGVEHLLPGTERIVRLRSLDAAELLREGNIPDILTPVIIKSVYQELTEREIRDLMNQKHQSAEEALKFIEAIEYVCERSIVDGTKVKDLTLGEKRWIFRLAIGSAELLITFRYDPTLDVESVPEGEDVQQTPE